MHAKFAALSALFAVAAAYAPYGVPGTNPDPAPIPAPVPAPAPGPGPVPVPAPVPAPAPGPGPAPGGPSNCSTGPVQCCNSVQDASSSPVQTLLGLLGVALGSVTGQVGVTCTPIDVIGVGGNSCNAQTVCCNNNNFNGLVALGCTPININL